jgi:hypothetical protein
VRRRPTPSRRESVTRGRAHRHEPTGRRGPRGPRVSEPSGPTGTRALDAPTTAGAPRSCLEVAGRPAGPGGAAPTPDRPSGNRGSPNGKSPTGKGIALRSSGAGGHRLDRALAILGPVGSAGTSPAAPARRGDRRIRGNPGRGGRLREVVVLAVPRGSIPDALPRPAPSRAAS